MLTETESPSARILPEPLPDAEPPGTDTPEPAEARSTVVDAPPPRKPLPLEGALGSEPGTLGLASGVQLTGTFAWPPARGLVRTEDSTEPSWPVLSVQLVPTFKKEPGRARFVFSSSVWGLPQGTELRARSDYEGFIIVWPDGRSYRVVAQGALRALLEERRVDRMPLVPVQIEELGLGKRLARPTRKLLAKGPVGALQLDLAEVPESGLESHLLCDFFFGLIRAATPEGVCRPGELPFFADVQSPGEASLQFSVSEVAVRSDLERSAFLVPPHLSIYKPGELPPDTGALWPSSVLSEIMPPSRDGPEVRFRNHHDVPIFLLLDAVPVRRIDPGGEVVWRATPGEHRHAARDFLGQVMEPGGVLTPPATIDYGEPVVEEREAP